MPKGLKLLVLVMPLLLACGTSGQPEHTSDVSPTATAMPTATPTPAGIGAIVATPTATPTPIQPPTPTSTATATYTPTATLTPTPAGVPTLEGEPKATPTPTQPPTPTSTATATYTPTPTPTSTPTPTPTHTLTPIPTATVIVAPTPSPTATAIATPIPTSTPSSSGVMVVIECIYFDGLVPVTEADEYVQIANLGDIPADLTGWRLIDISDSSPTFDFPLFTLEPGKRIRVYTNEDHPERGGFSFERGVAIWNNTDPDVAALINAQSEQVSTKSYPPGC